MKLVIFLLYDNLSLYQVPCTLIYRRHSLYSFLLESIFLKIASAFCENRIRHAIYEIGLQFTEI